jgi:drug/metabolite transporter (DMT)-like permease
MQLLLGGGLLVALGLLSGEGARFDPAVVPGKTILWWLYLITFGSIVAFSAYVWLLRVTSPTRATTYAFVNPVVALFLGWLLGGETLNGRTLVAAAMIVAAVAMIILGRGRLMPSAHGVEAVETG